MSADQKQTTDPYYDRGYTAQDVALAIIGGGLANAIALLLLNGPFTLWNSIVGIIILCILVAYAPAPSSRPFLKFAFAAICSISFLSTIGILFNMPFDLKLVVDRFGDLFPDTSAVCFLAFRASIFYRSCNAHPPNMPETIFTPFNIYDGLFFLAWIVISIIFYWFFFGRGKK